MNEISISPRKELNDLLPTNLLSEMDIDTEGTHTYEDTEEEIVDDLAIIHSKIQLKEQSKIKSGSIQIATFTCCISTNIKSSLRSKAAFAFRSNTIR